MFSKNQNGISRRFPVITLTVVAAAMFILLLPGSDALLAYDRMAILNGELWRLFTGHWVHFSTRHFIYDVGVFGIVGSIIEARGYKHFGWLCALSPLAISISLLIFNPQLAIYGGLSGIATAAVVFVALNGLRGNSAWVSTCAIVLMAIIAKIAFEFSTGRLVFLHLADDSISSVPLCHLVGALTAAAIYLWERIRIRPPVTRPC